MGFFTHLWEQIILMLKLDYFFFFFSLWFSYPYIRETTVGKNLHLQWNAGSVNMIRISKYLVLLIKTLDFPSSLKHTKKYLLMPSLPFVARCTGKTVGIQRKPCQRWAKNVFHCLFLWQFGHSCQSYIRGRDKKIHIWEFIYPVYYNIWHSITWTCVHFPSRTPPLFFNLGAI